jgi:hypothetical protein
VADKPPARRAPSDYRPDLRPMLILIALLAVVVFGWAVIGPRILPGTVVQPPGNDLDGDWARAPDGASATLTIADGTYALAGTPEFTGSGTAVLYQGELILSADPGCPDAVGRYEIGAEASSSASAPAARMTLRLIEDACGRGTRATAVSGDWFLLHP